MDSERAGVEVVYTASHERPIGSGSCRSDEFSDPVRALMFLAWDMGQDERISFSDGIDVMRSSPDEVASYHAWRGFVDRVLGGESAVLDLFRSRWRVVRERRVCSDGPGPDCSGGVAYHAFLSGTGDGSWRCDAHWDASVERNRASRERYPDRAPSGFGPSYAGEVWEEDDW